MRLIDIDQDEFILTFSKRNTPMYSALLKSLIPYTPDELKFLKGNDNKHRTLAKLHSRVASGEYFPKPPRGYVLEEKTNGLPRFVPVLHFEDSLVYSWCTQRFRSAPIYERARNTYGAWEMGGELRIAEDEELDSMGEEYEIPDSEYSFASSFDPLHFRQVWRGYQRCARLHSQDARLTYFISLDIASFYDSVNLDILEYQLRSDLHSQLSSTIDLTFAFLRFWNRAHQGYSAQTVGIPQEEIGDKSRLLANYYLRRYDEAMNLFCQSIGDGSRYLRYADDQIVMSSDKSNAEKILFHAATLLHSIGLTINSGKVKRFPNRKSFNYYWGFEMFPLLDDKESSIQLNSFVDQYFSRIDAFHKDPITFDCRLHSMMSAVLFRLNDEGMTKNNRGRIIHQALVPSNLRRLDRRKLKILLSRLSKGELASVSKIAYRIAIDSPFTHFGLAMNHSWPNTDRPEWLIHYVNEKVGMAARLTRLSL